MNDIAIGSDRVVFPDAVRSATVVVRGGRITEILPPGVRPPDLPFVDASGYVVGPGLVDSHVHVNEPGRTEWEGYATATRSAAAGGVTTLVDMPLNSIPPTTSVAALRTKQAAAQGKCWIDVAFWGGLTSSDTREIGAMAEAGVCGFKVFLLPSGVPEFGHVDEDGLRAGLTAARRARVPIVIHAEAPGVIDAAPPPTGRRYADYLASRPAEAEVQAIRGVVALAAETGGHAHVLHLSTARALDELVAARRGGAPVTAETCPHYLSLAAEEIPDGQTSAKCAPPVREGTNRDMLFDGLRDGLLSSVVSDHSPSSPEVKALDSGDFGAAWGGISGVQTQLPVVWTAARVRGISLVDLARWNSAAPAALAGLPRKGMIAVGNDADLVVWDPDAEWTVDPALLSYRHPLSPWAGQTLHGVVRTTYLRGVAVDPTAPPRGQLLGRETLL